MEQTCIGRLCNQIRGVSYKPKDLHDSADGNAIVLLRPNNINNGEINFDDVVFVDRSRVKEEQILKPNDVLICASSGSKSLVGKAATFTGDRECTFGAFCKVVRPNKGYENYLSVFFQSPYYRRNIAKASAGANINNIRNEDIDNLVLPIISSDEQDLLTEKIKKCNAIIKKKKLQLNLLDDLIKSRFVEMFGNPMDFKKANTTFTKTVIFNPKKSEIADKKQLEVSFVPMECVGTDGSFSIQRNGLINEFYKGYTYFKDDDVLIAKITPCFENGKSAIAKGCTNGIGFGTTEFHVARPIEGKSTAEWIQYLFKNNELHNYASTKMAGAAGQKRIQTPFFEELPVYLPAYSEQVVFSNFVTQVNKSKFIFEDRLQILKMLMNTIMHMV